MEHAFQIECAQSKYRSAYRVVWRSFLALYFEEAEIVALLDSISSESSKDVRDKAIFSVPFYSWCRVSALTNLSVWPASGRPAPNQPANKPCPDSKSRHTGILHIPVKRQRNIKTH